MRRLQIASLAALTLVAGALAGCSGGGGGGSSKSKLEGVWQRAEGSLFVTDGLEELRFLDLRDGGRGTLYGLQNSTGIRECSGLLYSVSSEGTVTLDVPDLNGGLSQARLLLWDRDGSELTITDQDGNATLFTKTDEVPATEACTYPTTTVVPLQTQFPGYSGNLAAAGGFLWYENSLGQLVSIDPLTGTTASTLASSPGYPVAAEAGGNLWTICHCGGDETITRWALPSTNVDDVNMDTVSGHNFSIEAAAVSSSSGHLWVAGYQYDTATNALYEIDTSAEPDLLLQGSEGPLDGRAFTFVDGERWVLAYGLTAKIVRIGPDGLAAATLSLPGAVSYSSSFTSLDGDFYLTIYDAQYQSALMRVQVP